MHIQTDLGKESIEFRAIRQRLRFGITAPHPLTNLLDGETLLCFANAQAAQCADAKTQRPFGGHPTGIKLLATRNSGVLAHGSRQVQQAFVAEGLAAMRLLRLRHFVKLLKHPEWRGQCFRSRQIIGDLAELVSKGCQFLRAGDDRVPGNPA